MVSFRGPLAALLLLVASMARIRVFLHQTVQAYAWITMASDVIAELFPALSEHFEIFAAIASVIISLACVALSSPPATREARLERQLTESKTKLRNAEKRLEAKPQLERQLAEAETKLVAAQSEVEDSRKQIKTLKDDLKTVQNEETELRAELEGQLTESQTKLLKAQEQTGDCDKQILTLKEDVKTTRTRVGELETELYATKQKFKDEESSVKVLCARLATSKNEAKAAVAREDAMRQELGSVKAKLNDSDKQLEKQIQAATEAQGVVADLTYQRNGLQDLVSSLNERSQEWKAETDSRSSFKLQMQKLESTNTTLQNNLDKRSRYLQAEMDEKAIVELQKEELKSTTTRLQDSLDEANTRSGTLKSELSVERNHTTELQNKLDKFETTATNVHERIQDLERQLKSLTAEKVTWESKNQEKTVEVKALTDRVRDLEGKLQSLTTEKVSWESKDQEKTAEAKALAERIQDLEAQLKSITSENVTWKSKDQEKSAKVQELEGQVESLTTEKFTWQNNDQTKTTKFEYLEDQVENLTTENANRQNINRKKIAEVNALSDRIVELKGWNSNKANMLDIAYNTIRTHLKSIEGLVAQNAELASAAVKEDGNRDEPSTALVDQAVPIEDTMGEIEIAQEPGESGVEVPAEDMEVDQPGASPESNIFGQSARFTFEITPPQTVFPGPPAQTAQYDAQPVANVLPDLLSSMNFLFGQIAEESHDPTMADLWLPSTMTSTEVEQEHAGGLEGDVEMGEMPTGMAAHASAAAPPHTPTSASAAYQTSATALQNDPLAALDVAKDRAHEWWVYSQRHCSADAAAAFEQRIRDLEDHEDEYIQDEGVEALVERYDSVSWTIESAIADLYEGMVDDEDPNVDLDTLLAGLDLDVDEPWRLGDENGRGEDSNIDPSLSGSR